MFGATETFRVLRSNNPRQSGVPLCAAMSALTAISHGNPVFRNLGLAARIALGIVKPMNADDKFMQEHSAPIENFLLTRRQFLSRAPLTAGQE